MTNIRNAMMAAAGGAGLDGYVVENSLLLNDDDSAHLTTTMGTFDSNDIGTVSFWFKRGNNGISHMHLFTHGTAILRLRAKIGSTDAIWIETATGTQKKTTQVFRDNQAWYHIVVACDSTQASNSDRIKLYINGTQVTDFETDTAHTQNQDFFFNAEAWWVGSYLDTTLNSDGYMSQFCFIDGQQLTPSSFGEFDDQGYWRPIDLSGLTFGTNGFLQDYSDSSHFGKNAAVADPTAYVPVSVNFDGSADYLTVTSATLGAGDAKTGCGSVWFKNGGSDGTNRHIVSGTSSHFAVYLNTSNQLRVTGEDASHVSAFTMVSTQTFTSSNADKWYHVAWSYDAASASNQMYINGVAENLSTDTNSDRDIDYTIDYVVGARHTYFDENWTGDIADLYLNFATNIDLSNASNLAEFISADGLPVDLGSDGSTPTASAPIIYLNQNTLATWHTNAGSGGGFTEVGALTAGSAVRNAKSNDFTNNNTVVTSTHTPTNIHTQLNGVWNEHFQVGSGRATITLSNGNRTGAYSVSGSEGDSAIATTLVFPNTGKFHWEWVCDSVGAHANSGLICMIVPAYQHHEDDVQGADGIVLLYHNADKTAGNTIFSEGVEELAADSDGLTATDRFSYDWDIAGGICIVKKDGSPIKTITGITVPTSPHFILFRTNAGASTRAVTWTANFEADNFVDTPAADHVAINTTNIAEATTRTVSDPYEHWANCLYDGTGAALDITIANETPNGSTFDPEFVWTKNRDQNDEHKIVDIVRGATKELNSDSNNAESTDANGVTSITSTDKYVLGTGAGGYNDSGEAFVGWAAKLGGAAVANTDGSITSSVSANTTLGMSVGTYTGSGSTATVGHGLSTTPGMIIVKKTSGAGDSWTVYHSGNTSAPETDYLSLDVTAATSDYPIWNDTAPTSSVFSVYSAEPRVNETSATYMFIAFAPSEFISIGSYEGNANADGPYVPCINSAGIPLQPIWSLVKNIDTVKNWVLIDAGREPYNVMDNHLEPDTSDAEPGEGAGDWYRADMVSGGIKLRGTGQPSNYTTLIHLTIGIPVIDKAGRILTAR